MLADLVESAGKYNDVVENSNLTDANVENRPLYDEMLRFDSPDKIIPGIYNDPVIKFLEDKYKINNLQYQIGSYVFSRKKVLRVASSLIPKQKIDFDSFLYIMTYKRIIDKRELPNLEELLKGTYDLSKSYSI